MNVSELESRIATLEEHAVLRSELRAEIKRAALELRDDSDFTRPYWQGGADTATEHLFTKASRKVLIYIVGACAAGLLLWIGSLGVLWK